MDEIVKEIQSVLKKYDAYIIARIGFNGKARMGISFNDKNKESISIGTSITSDQIFNKN